jgi:hypothetical protein
MLELWDGTRKNDKHQLLTWTCTKKTRQQVDWCIIWTFLVLGWATGKFRLPRFTTAQTWGCHHLPPYSTLCLSARPTSKWHFVPGLPSGSSKMPTLRLLRLWGLITLCVDIRLRWGLKQSCSFIESFPMVCRDNTFTQGNWVDSRLLVVENQTANLTPDLSFGHNLCFRCPNESCEPILNMYVPRAFQWSKELFNPLSFDSCNYSLKIWKSIGTPTPKVGAPLGMW